VDGDADERVKRLREDIKECLREKGFSLIVDSEELSEEYGPGEVALWIVHDETAREYAIVIKEGNVVR